jgi:hypothetical protein
MGEGAAGAAEVHSAPELAVTLRAGPLRLVFDRGALRWIRLGEREVLRGIYVAVREADWATVPAELEDLEIEVGPESFRVCFVARHRRGPVRFDWKGRIEGAPDGRLTFSMEGVAASTFLRNRIGICVLHPVEECAGRRCIIETVDGDRAESAFPALVAPHQPFRNLRAIMHEVTPGVEAEIRMEGETFETEDQRNWSDASFKTYGTPLHLPYPVEVREGTVVSQFVTVSLFGVTAEPVCRAAAAVPGALPKRRNNTEPVIVRVDPARTFPRPAIGLGGGGLSVLPEADQARLRPLQLGHLRADLHLESPVWEAALARAAANALSLGTRLEAAVFLPENPRPALDDLAGHVLRLRPPVASWLLFRASDGLTADGSVALARRALSGVDPGARFGGGTDRYFVELNRRRPSSDGLELLVFALTPQAHAFDDATLVENIDSLRWIADTSRGFAGGAALGISPVTLRPRAGPRPGDPRQSAAFAAAWTLGFVAAAAEAGFASLTFYELTGPRGVVEGGESFPVFRALLDLAAWPDVLLAHSRRPERVRVLAVGSRGTVRIFLANVTSEPHPVRVEGLGGRVRRAALGDVSPGGESGFEMELTPHGIARLDVEAART